MNQGFGVSDKLKLLEVRQAFDPQKIENLAETLRRELDRIGIGTRIEIIRSGEVIPKLEAVLEASGAVLLPDACPSCGRAEVDLIGITKAVEEATKDLTAPCRVAVMGCIVNGPGEAKAADLVIATD